MRKALLAVASLFFVIITTAQTAQSYVRPPSLGFSFVLYDFVTPMRVKQSSLSTVLREKNMAKFTDMGAGIALSYFKGMRDKIDFAGTFTVGSASYTLPGTLRTPNTDLLLQADASAHFKMVPDKYFLSPYVIAGIGANKFGSYYGAFIPVGLGMRFNFFEEASVFVNARHHVPVTEETVRGHMYYSFGIAGALRERQPVVKEVVVPQAPVDSDNDGIPNERDKCPDVAGVEKYEGCPVPDTDKDGINDEADSCINVAGVSKYNGCPVPDSDGDGINDDSDKCPNEAGVEKYGGCPVPDTDKDGINDEEDKCPQLPGVAANNGCPEIKEAVRKRVAYNATRIFFVTGSYKLSSKSNKALDDMVAILKSDADLKLSIEGHTDNVGKDEFNQTLSEQRAASVKAYLVKKGIDESRLAAQGFGETQPVADNKTAAGRSRNRRVVMTVNYY